MIVSAFKLGIFSSKSSFLYTENRPRNNEVVTFLVQYRGNFKTNKFDIQFAVLLTLKSELMQVKHHGQYKSFQSVV